MTLKAIQMSTERIDAPLSQKRSSVLRYNSTFAFGAVIVLTMVAAIWLRWTGLNAQSMWADEGYTTWFSQFSPAEQWHLLPWETQGPIYHILLHYWVSLWGTSVVSFRALSALFSTLSLAVFYLIARKMWSSRSFLILGLLLYSLSYFQIWYAKETRCYALLAFLLLASVYCELLTLEKATVLRLCGCALALSATLYTHNMAMFYLPGFVVVWFAYPSQMGLRRRIRNAMVVGAMVFLLYLPWLPILIKQIKAVHGYYWAPKPSLIDLLTSLCTFSGIDEWILQGVHHYVPIPRVFGFWTWIPILLGILALCLVGTWRNVCSEDRRKSVSLQVFTLLPILLVFLWSRISTSVYVNRNLIGACALLPLVFCAPIAVQIGNRRKAFEIIACVILAGTVISLCLHREDKDDWRGVTAYLLKLPERERLVVVIQPYCQILVHYYSTGQFSSYPKPDITGLVTQFNVAPTGPGILPDLAKADPLAILSPAISLHRYREIDVALQLDRLPVRVQAIPEYLQAHCSSVENMEFGRIGVSRCFLQPN